jgi:hypothetical protein
MRNATIVHLYPFAENGLRNRTVADPTLLPQNFSWLTVQKTDVFTASWPETILRCVVLVSIDKPSYRSTYRIRAKWELIKHAGNLAVPGWSLLVLAQ